MTTVGISVVLATNRGADNPFLAETLASACRQSTEYLELVIVDDGGPREFGPEDLPGAPPRARVVRTPGGGPARARNIGARVVRGDLIAFLDDDDVWEPERLEAHTRAMRADPGLALTYSRMRSVDDEGRTIASADQIPISTTSDVYRRRTGIMLPNSVVRADAFRAVGGFDESLRLAEDLDLVFRLAAHGGVAMVGSRSLVSYRRHRGNATRRHRDLATAIRGVVARHLEQSSARGESELVSALVESQQANDRFAIWSAGRAARSALGEHRPAAAWAEVVWAVRFAPHAPLRAAIRRVNGQRHGERAERSS
ncbi:glycosyltransferase [Isoptericola chiayiensis]|uniref:Glycosyltransferase n=1 Tax=Isoptericola chiayiensis TaxID=579446 RepID=A0ABP8Y3P4_9MICO|nr:glycosyltransferase family A protein [Isoptericola chiayiensis]NOV99436.1 glycosyltransferase involved in cell wall biosynthesis [Isoptericola chiayiensis]